MSYEEDSKLMSFKTANRIKCKCGHSIFTYDDTCICRECGRLVRSKKADMAYFRNEVLNAIDKLLEKERSI